jgi:hypothetical protein
MPSEADPAGDDGSLVRAQSASEADLAGRDVLGAEPSERVSLDGGDTLTVPDVHYGRLPEDELSYQAAIVAAIRPATTGVVTAAGWSFIALGA